MSWYFEDLLLRILLCLQKKNLCLGDFLHSLIMTNYFIQKFTRGYIYDLKYGNVGLFTLGCKYHDILALKLF